jgi:hypothetical protein
LFNKSNRLAILRFSSIRANTSQHTRRTNARPSPLHRHDALSPQEYWRIFDRNLISRNSCRAFIVDAGKAPTKSL